MEVVYHLIALVARVLFGVLRWRIRTEGIERVPREGPVILASNHIGYWDPVVLGLALRRVRRWARFLAKHEVFSTPVLGWMARRTDQIPVDRGGTAGESIEAAADRIAQGQVVTIYPEGTISTAFLPMPAKTGAVRLAQRTGAPLVPVAVWGTQRLATKGRKRRWRPGTELRVHIGEPLDIAPEEDPAEGALRLTDAMTALVEAAACAYGQQPDGDRWWLPASLGGTAPTLAEAEAARAAEAEARRRRSPPPDGG